MLEFWDFTLYIKLKVTFHLNFKENAMIRIVDDLHGYAPGNRCTHHPDDCVIHSAGQRSIVSQICSSKSRCRDLIITRQHCNDRVTSYQQITYECVPSKLLGRIKILSMWTIIDPHQSGATK